MASQAQTPAQQFTPPANVAQLIEWLTHKHDIGRPAVTEAQMKLNLAFVLGYQWVTWDQRIRAYVRPRIDVSDPNAPVRLTSNKIAPLLERTVAKLTKSAPEPECRPVSDNDNDVSTARVGDRVLSSELNRLKWKPWLQQFMFSPGITGFAYAHVWWDPSDGSKVADEDGDDDALFEGNICLDIVPGFELRVDPAAKTMTAAKWAVRETTMTRESAWERWGVTLQGGGRRSLAMEVMALGNNADARPMGQDWVQVKQFWMVPCRAAPKGLVVTWAENEIIEKKVFPYEHGRLPFVQCNFLPPLEGMREGRTIVTDLIPLQVDYNDALSREATIRRQLTPKLIAAVGSVDPQRITSRVEVIEWLPTGPPPSLEQPNAAWAQQFEIGMNRDDKDMGERAGISDASTGQTASSAPAAGILALQEADDTKLAVTATELAQFIADVGWQILMLAKQYWAEERTVRTWSDEDVLEAYRYLGSDIDDQLDVHVSAESALPKSKSARAQLFLELAARYPQVFQAQDLIRMLDVPGTDFITRTLDADTRKQYREIGQMLQGKTCEVQAFDNHQIHLQVLNNFRKSTDYENLPIEQQAMFDAHAAVHESLVLKQLGIAVPTPQPTQDPAAMQQADRASAGPASGQVGTTSPYLTDPMTGQPGDPMAAASGQAPSTAEIAGIGQAAGQPGRVPGIPVDNQAASMGQ